MNKTIRVAFGFILGAAVALADTLSPGQLEQQLKELSRAPVDYAAAGKWFNLAKALSSDGQRQEALMAAAAALIYVGKGDVYQQNIKTKIDDVSTFEGQFLGDCPDCRGGGESERPCPACKGSGRCQYANCQGGRHRIHQINGDKYEPCRECKGTGQCQKCGGNGRLEGKCVRCGGSGKSMDKEQVLAAYKKHADAAAKWAQREREREERERKEAEERAEREREREERERKEEELAEEMRARGLVNVGGKWMTPGSVRNVAYRIFQIYEPGHALCRDKYGTVFCLLYSAEDNRAVAEGDVLKNDLYRCGTYSYITVQDAPSTVRQFAIDLPVALKEIERQGLD